MPFRFNLADPWLFVGIGTILNWPMMHGKVVVFGAGLGYGEVTPRWLQHARAQWKFYCVRGPLTARILQLDPGVAIADPGLLVHRYVPAPQLPRSGSIAVVPHWATADSRCGDALARTCDELRYAFVDPRHEVDDILPALAGSDLVLTESLHGAIVADALRVPWVPLRIRRNPHTSPFKWEDWCASMELPYEPTDLDVDEGTCAALQRASQSRGFLSHPLVFEQRIEALEQRLHTFIRDVTDGLFNC